MRWTLAVVRTMHHFLSKPPQIQSSPQFSLRRITTSFHTERKAGLKMTPSLLNNIAVGLGLPHHLPWRVAKKKRSLSFMKVIVIVVNQSASPAREKSQVQRALTRTSVTPVRGRRRHHRSKALNFSTKWTHIGPKLRLIKKNSIEILLRFPVHGSSRDLKPPKLRSLDNRTRNYFTNKHLINKVHILKVIILR